MAAMTADKIETVVAWAMGVFCPLTPKERVALIGDCIKPTYQYDTVVAVIKGHARKYGLLRLPELEEALADAHQDRKTEIKTVHDEAARELSEKAAGKRAEREAAAKSLDGIAEEYAQLLEREPATVAELIEAYSTVNPKAPVYRGRVAHPENVFIVIKSWVVRTHKGLTPVA